MATRKKKLPRCGRLRHLFGTRLSVHNEMRHLHSCRFHCRMAAYVDGYMRLALRTPAIETTNTTIVISR